LNSQEEPENPEQEQKSKEHVSISGYGSESESIHEEIPSPMQRNYENPDEIEECFFGMNFLT